MLLIENLITYNREKLEFLNEYIAANEMIELMAQDQNFTSIRGLVDKKRGMITSINIIDDKVLYGIKRLKEEVKVNDLSEINVSDYPDLKILKIISGKVLRQMVAIKHSDDKVSDYINKAFTDINTSTKVVDRNKLYHYTNNYFED
jgi:hypothetical protein